MLRILLAASLIFVLAGCGDNEIRTSAPSSGGNAPGTTSGDGSSESDPPAIGGTPAALVKVGDTYSFTPQVQNIAAENLAFSINKKMPDDLPWATFDQNRGTLSGVPTEDHIGTYTDIVITAHDKSAPNRTAVLPAFSIQIWGQGIDLPVALRQSAAASVKGEVFLFGGEEGTWKQSSTVYQFKSRYHEWQPISFPLQSTGFSPRFGHAAVVHNDQIFLLGGFQYVEGTEPQVVTVPLGRFDQFTYTPEASTLQPKANMLYARGGLCACIVGEKLYAIGGWGEPTALKSTEIYDFSQSQGAWIEGPSLNFPREKHQCFSLDNKLIYVVGGSDRTGTAFPMEVLDTTDPAGQWQVIEPAMKLDGGTLQVIDGRAYLFGGFDGKAQLNSVLVFDPASQGWKPAPVSLPMSRAEGASALVNGKVWLLGGVSSAESKTNAVHIHGPAFGQ